MKYNSQSMSLVNTKFLNKTLQPNSIYIIHHDQIGFIVGMQGWFIICKSIKSSTQHINRNDGQELHYDLKK
jgi:hypothetical protein